MQLRSLTVQALGPFAGRHTVDFAALGASGLFLLEGPTGSGKSTLIDAVVFALYGKVASADASDDRLRSAYAAEDVPTVVDLTFEVASGVYRVRRTPGYDRPKKRGTGTVKQQPSITLWRLGPDDPAATDPDALPAGDVLSTRLDEAGAEIQHVVGLDRTQFVQTVVLPQGEFARFLRANPEDRRGLLQKIFGTEVYDRIGRRLVELRRESAAAVEAARTALGTAGAQLVGAARLDAEDAAVLRAALDAAAAEDAADGADTVRAVVDGLRHDVGAAADQARARAAVAESARAAARSALDDATRTADLVRRRARLRSDRAALAEGAPVHEEAQARLARARAAQAVRPLLRRADEATATLEAAAKTLDAALDTAPDDLADLARTAFGPGSGTALDLVRADARARPFRASGARRGLDAQREADVARSGAVDRLVAVEAGLEAQRHEVRNARTAAEDLHAEIAVHDTWLAARPDARSQLEGALHAARELAGAVEGRAARVAALEELGANLRALDAARAAHGAAREALAEAAGVARDAVAHEAALRNARIAGLAGELAAALRDGDPCSVCGAVEHPTKAPLAPDHVSAADVQRAEDARAVAEESLRAADSRAAECAERVAGLTRTCAGARPDEVAELLAEARAALDVARASAAEVPRLDEELRAHDDATRLRSEERQEAATALAAAEVRAETLAQALASAEAEVAAGHDGFPTVAARHAALRERIAAASTLADALLDLEHAARQAQEHRTELAAALAEHGFADIDDARDAGLDPTALDELVAGVEAYTAAVAAVTAGLADATLAALPEDVDVDLDAARAAESDARTAAEHAAGEARVALDRATAVETAAADVLAAAERVVEHAAAHAPVARLAALAAGTGGDNAHALSLATYVLTRRFEDVVAAANDRLAGMSDGRYELVRSDRKEDVTSRRTGLSMRVVDHRTGHERDPRTLSGGETFYVSLCLALGLADVVSAEAGGIDLGTLFVDEGFGSLDPHTLEQVLTELGRLRAGGRVVGVVSHVDTLKQAIADRIEVRPTPHGPSTLTVRAG